MQVWNMLHAARWKCRMQKIAKKSPTAHIVQLCRAISLQLRHISTIGKKLVKQQYLLQMSPQYGELRPTSSWDRSGIWGTPANFNSFCVLAVLLHGSQVVEHQPNFAALNRGRHLCSAGRPSRLALAHILVLWFFFCYYLPNTFSRFLYQTLGDESKRMDYDSCEGKTSFRDASTSTGSS